MDGEFIYIYIYRKEFCNFWDVSALGAKHMLIATLLDAFENIINLLSGVLCFLLMGL